MPRISQSNSAWIQQELFSNCGTVCRRQATRGPRHQSNPIAQDAHSPGRRRGTEQLAQTRLRSFIESLAGLAPMNGPVLLPEAGQHGDVAKRAELGDEIEIIRRELLCEAP